MGSLWGPITIESQLATDVNVGRVVAQLPDGTEIFVLVDSAGANLKLYYTTDRVTTNLIATWSLPSSDPDTVALCVDASSNIYVAYPNGGSTSGGVKAFVKGAGYTWTPATALTIDGTNWSLTSTLSSLLWCNTGGGTGGAGHLLCVYRSAAGSVPVVGSLDAGVALAGTGTIIAGAFTGVPAGGNATVMDASADGFGATQGLIATHRVTLGPDVDSWQMTAAGALTLAVVSHTIAGFDTTIFQPGRLLSYAPGAQGWVLLSKSSATPTQVAAATLSLTALTAAAVVLTPTGGDWGNVGTSENWDAFVDPDAPNRVYLLAWANATLFAVRQLGLTCSPLAWDTTDTLADYPAGFAWGPSGQFNIRCTNEPFGPVVDFIAYTDTAGSVYQASGSSYQVEGSVNFPTLLTPANGVFYDVASGTIFTWVYNPADGSTQAGYCLRYKISGAGSYRYWNATLNASQSTPIWNPTSSQTAAISAAAMLNGHIYNWSISTISNTRIESGFAADFTIDASKSPSVSVTAPTGTVAATSYPVVTWINTLAPGASQISYRICLYTAAQAAIGGFVAGVSPSTWDSGTVMSTATAVTIPVDVPNATGWKVYVAVGQTGGQVSIMASTTFTEAATLPTAPSIVATATTDPSGTACISLVATDHEGSLTGATTLTIVRSDGTTVRATPVAVPSAGAVVTVYDYEVIPGVAYTYTATVTSATGPVTSVPSAASGATLTTTAWWAIELTNSALNCALNVTDDVPTQMLERSASHYGLGSKYPTVVADVVGGVDGTLTVSCFNAAQFAQVLALLQAQQVLWLSNPYGEARYVRLGVPSGSSGGSDGGNTAKQTTLSPSAASAPYRIVTLTYVEMSRP